MDAAITAAGTRQCSQSANSIKLLFGCCIFAVQGRGASQEEPSGKSSFRIRIGLSSAELRSIAKPTQAGGSSKSSLLTRACFSDHPWQESLYGWRAQKEDEQKHPPTN